MLPLRSAGSKGGESHSSIGIGGLHVVVAVDQALSAFPRRAASRRKRADGLGVDEADVLHADALEFGSKKFGGTAAIVFVFGQRGDGWNAKKIFQFVQKARVILVAKSTAGEDMSVLPFNEIDRGEYRRLGSDGAVPPTRERSIAWNLRIDFGDQASMPPRKRLHVFESLIAQPGGDIERSLSVMAENREVLFGIEFLMWRGPGHRPSA